MNGYNSTSSGRTDDQGEKVRSTPSDERPDADPQREGKSRPVEIGGRKKGLEPTRYGDWEKDGRCIDF